MANTEMLNQPDNNSASTLTVEKRLNVLERQSQGCRKALSAQGVRTINHIREFHETVKRVDSERDKANDKIRELDERVRDLESLLAQQSEINAKLVRQVKRLCDNINNQTSQPSKTSQTSQTSLSNNIRLLPEVDFFDEADASYGKMFGYDDESNW